MKGWSQSSDPSLFGSKASQCLSIHNVRGKQAVSSTRGGWLGSKTSVRDFLGRGVRCAGVP